MKRLTYFLLVILIILSMSTIALANNSQESITNVYLKSDNYIVLENNLIISRILPKTTIENFKTNFQVDGSKIHVYDVTGEKEITQGYIGTGMKVKIENSNKLYETSVIGDLNGNGELGQIEISKTIRHVIGLANNQLKGYNAISVDINADGNIDQIDITIMIRYVVYGRLEIEELIKPTSPNIEFVSGTKGENDWYISDVVLRVKKPETFDIEIAKMTYQVTGTINSEEKEIQDGTTITIQEEGIHEIICYSYSAIGVTSQETKYTVKIDKTAPICANLIGKYNDENGEEYTFNTTSYVNVYAETTEGEDSISGIEKVTIEAIGANNISAGTQGAILLENERNNTNNCNYTK